MDPEIVRRITALEQEVERLRARGADVRKGGVFPASPSTAQEFFRTDLGWLCLFDGARWLTAEEFPVTITSAVTVGGTVGQTEIPIRTDYAPYISRCVVTTNVAAPNSGANYWQVQIQGINLALSAADDVYVFNTSTHTAATNTRTEGISTAPTPSNRHALRTLANKLVGAPGNLTLSATVYYRLVVT